MQLPDFLTKLPDGEIQLTGHRIGLYHLIQRYSEGESAEMIAVRYPTLSLSLVHRVIAFYLDNSREVDAYIASCSAAINDQQRLAPRVNLNALRWRLANQKSSAPEAQVR